MIHSLLGLFRQSCYAKSCSVKVPVVCAVLQPVEVVFVVNDVGPLLCGLALQLAVPVLVERRPQRHPRGVPLRAHVRRGVAGALHATEARLLERPGHLKAIR